MHGEFPVELKQFIDFYIESVPQLEALLLLHSDPLRHWQLADLAKSLYIPEGAAAGLLIEFVRRGFAILQPPPDAGYVYHSRDAEVDRLIEQLATAYHERRVAIVSLIYSKPLHRVQTFADAFRFGKEKPK